MGWGYALLRGGGGGRAQFTDGRVGAGCVWISELRHTVPMVQGCCICTVLAPIEICKAGWSLLGSSVW